MTTITNEVRFMHLRYHDDNIQMLPNGGLTIAYTVADINNMVDPADNVKSVLFALAKCHENDSFVKHVGRCKAAGRLKSSELFTKYGGYLEVPGTADRGEIQKAVLAEVRSKFELEENLV
jgi:hypothetical protein